jgi:hypothetical protein
MSLEHKRELTDKERREIERGKQQWIGGPYIPGTSPANMMASPWRQALLAGLTGATGGGLAGAGIGSKFESKDDPTGRPTAIGGLAGAGAVGLLSAAIAALRRAAYNRSITATMRDAPPDYGEARSALEQLGSQDPTGGALSSLLKISGDCRQHCSECARLKKPCTDCAKKLLKHAGLYSSVLQSYGATPEEIEQIERHARQVMAWRKQTFQQMAAEAEPGHRYEAGGSLNFMDDIVHNLLEENPALAAKLYRDYELFRHTPRRRWLGLRAGKPVGEGYIVQTAHHPLAVDPHGSDDSVLAQMLAPGYYNTVRGNVYDDLWSGDPNADPLKFLLESEFAPPDLPDSSGPAAASKDKQAADLRCPKPPRVGYNAPYGNTLNVSAAGEGSKRPKIAPWSSYGTDVWETDMDDVLGKKAKIASAAIMACEAAGDFTGAQLIADKFRKYAAACAKKAKKKCKMKKCARGMEADSRYDKYDDRDIKSDHYDRPTLRDDGRFAYPETLDDRYGRDSMRGKPTYEYRREPRLPGVAPTMIGSTLDGTILGGLLGTGLGAYRGDVATGLGRGLLRGGATGLGMGAGQLAGDAIADAWTGGAGLKERALGRLIGALVGGTGAFAGAGALMGPAVNKRHEKAKAEEEHTKQLEEKLQRMTSALETAGMQRKMSADCSAKKAKKKCKTKKCAAECDSQKAMMVTGKGSKAKSGKDLPECQKQMMVTGPKKTPKVQEPSNEMCGPECKTAGEFIFACSRL